MDIKINSSPNFEYFKEWLNKECNCSTTLDFIRSLKYGVSLLLPQSKLGTRQFLINNKYFKLIKREDLSGFLGQKKNHIKEKKRYAKNNPDYKIALKYVQEYKNYLNINLKKYNIPQKIINEFFNTLINPYIKKHDPPYSNRYRSKHFHPNLKENYFECINTIEKSYWLGLLWADGWISRVGSSKTNYNFETGLKQSIKHKSLIIDYCNTIGFNINHLYKYQEGKKKSWIYQVRFLNKNFASYLIKHGFIYGKKKSLTIQFPIIKNSRFASEYELYLGFLLGYYDGDGSTGRTLISTGSRCFINQLKHYFKINKNILEQKYIKKDGTEGVVYKLALGRPLMAEMLRNFEFSLKLKRKEIGPKLKNDFHKFIKNMQNSYESGMISEKDYQKYMVNLSRKFEFTFSETIEICQKYFITPPSRKEWIKYSESSEYAKRHNLE